VASSSRGLRDSIRNRSCNAPTIYSKAPFAGPGVVVRYLARYTHRVAIGNSRLVSLENNRVSFTYRDYADDGARKVTSLSADHFITRFLLHVVPKRFVRIRHYGFLSHAKKRPSLSKLHAAPLCGAAPKPVSNPHSAPVCSCCGGTTWVKVAELKPVVRRLHSPPSIASPPELS
jgi:hypothetical protein